jgi:uncharacterized coiled-coil DUF342 family protein
MKQTAKKNSQSAKREDRIRSLEKANASLILTHQAWRESYSDVHQKNETLKKQLESATEKLSALELRNAVLSQRVSNLIEDVNQVVIKRDQFKKEAEEMRAKYCHSQVLAGTWQQEIEKVRGELNELKTTLAVFLRLNQWHHL